MQRTLGKNLKFVREQRGYSQKQVSMALGVSAPTVSDWEAGNTTPTVANLIRLCQLYRVRADLLLGTWNLLGDYLKKVRGNSDIASFSAYLGISAQSLTDLENGVRAMGTEDLSTIAAALGVDERYLLLLFHRVLPYGIPGVSIPADDICRELPEVKDLSPILPTAGVETRPSGGEEWDLLRAFREATPEEKENVRFLLRRLLPPSNTGRPE